MTPQYIMDRCLVILFIGESYETLIDEYVALYQLSSYNLVHLRNGIAPHTGNDNKIQKFFKERLEISIK